MSDYVILAPRNLTATGKCNCHVRPNKLRVCELTSHSHTLSKRSTSHHSISSCDCTNTVRFTDGNNWKSFTFLQNRHWAFWTLVDTELNPPRNPMNFLWCVVVFVSVILFCFSSGTVCIVVYLKAYVSYFALFVAAVCAYSKRTWLHHIPRT